VIHLKLAYFILVLMSGTGAISIAWSVYHRRRKRLILDYVLFLSSILLMLVSFIPRIYLDTGAAMSPDVADFVGWAAVAVGATLYVAAAPWFYYRLLGIVPRRPVRILHMVLAALFGAGSVGYLFSGAAGVIGLALNSILFATIGYGILLIGLEYRTLAEAKLRRALGVFFGLSALFFPLMYLDSLVDVVPGPPLLSFLNGLALPTFFLCLNVASILFAFRYLDRPPYLRDGELTSHFIDRYQITPREREIVEHLIDGLSTKEIGERLYISAKTVENHIYSIYQKTEVRNRVQLFTLVQSNRVE
jgi:DNA-binding CsgD family transcriptional regulator